MNAQEVFYVAGSITFILISLLAGFAIYVGFRLRSSAKDISAYARTFTLGSLVLKILRIMTRR